jgi:hypothetical protein
MGYDDRMGGPSRGRGGGGSRHNPYGRGGGGGRGDYEEEVIEISTNRLYVHNLSWRVSWQDLKDHFRQAGDVIHAKIMTEGPGGRSKGCGIVEMDTVDSAANAIEMLNDTNLSGRNILIREDREDNGGRGGGGYVAPRDRGPPPGRGGGPGAGDRCNKCGGVGHWARDCPSVVDIGRGGGGFSSRDRPVRVAREPREKKQAGPDDKCNRCGEMGHWARDCSQPDTREKRQPGPEDKCNKCGQLGHWARECPNAAADKPKDADGDNDMGAADAPLEDFNAEGDKAEDEAMAA